MSNIISVGLVAICDFKLGWCKKAPICFYSGRRSNAIQRFEQRKGNTGQEEDWVSYVEDEQRNPFFT